MPIFEVQAIVEGRRVSHVAEYPDAEAARAASEAHLGPEDRIEDVLECPPGLYADTRRLAAAICGQTADDAFQLL